TLGHNGSSSAPPARYVFLFDFNVARSVAHHYDLLVFARDDAVNGLAVLGFDTGGDEVGLHHAIGIKDVYQKLSGSVSPHPGQIRREVFALAFELVAHGAVL